MEKIKSLIQSEKGRDILTIIIIILVGFGSFILGKLSKEDISSNQINIEYKDKQANIINTTLPNSNISIEPIYISNNLMSNVQCPKSNVQCPIQCLQPLLIPNT